VVKVRALIVTANQAIIPKVAALAEIDPSRLVSLYRENMRALVFVTLPITALLVSWAGGFAWLLTGEYRSQLVHLIEILAIAWGFNIFTGPAYFINMGTGHIRWNTLSHMLMGVLNVTLCWLLGIRFGLAGVAFAYAIALIVPSALLIVVFAKRNQMHWTKLFQWADFWLLCFSAIVAWCGQAASAKYGIVNSPIYYVELAMSVPLLGLALWFHPLGYIIRSHLLAKPK
jgi:O-antigen/teichoic acid export membrane protein